MGFRFLVTLQTPLSERMYATTDIGEAEVELLNTSTVRGTLNLEIRPVDGSTPIVVLYPHAEPFTASLFVLKPTMIQIPCRPLVDKCGRFGTLTLKPVGR